MTFLYLYDNDVFKLVREGVGGQIRKKGTKCVNGWQLAKMKKSIPDMSLP